MDDGTLRATFVLMDTYTADGTFEEVEKATKSMIRETYGFIDNEIIRIYQQIGVGGLGTRSGFNE